MLILTIRTDKPEAELGLYDDNAKLMAFSWLAHRELSVTLHRKIQDLLARYHRQLSDLEGIVCYQGPGSFTGLRIGLTVGNSLAYALKIPIVAVMQDDWELKGLARLHAGEDDKITLPHYGGEAHITLPKK